MWVIGWVRGFRVRRGEKVFNITVTDVGAGSRRGEAGVRRETTSTTRKGGGRRRMRRRVGR